MDPLLFEIATILFLLMDPFGNMVLINSLLIDYTRNERRKIIFRESIFALVFLILITFSGSMVLNFLGLKDSSLRITGGIILFLISIRMVFPKSNTETEKVVDPFIVPIAIPLIAGPSSISMVIFYAHTYTPSMVSLSVLLSGGLSMIILFFSPTLFRWLGDRGSRAIERLMGILLIMISIQMLLDGVEQFISRYKG